MEKLTQRLSLRLSPELKEQIQVLARKEQRSVNFMGIVALRELLKKKHKRTR